MSAQLRHEGPNTTHKYYGGIERCVASKKPKDIWREVPIMVSDTLGINSKFEMPEYDQWWVCPNLNRGLRLPKPQGWTKLPHRPVEPGKEDHINKACSDALCQLCESFLILS